MEALCLICLMSVHNTLSVAGRNETRETDETNETLFFYASARSGKLREGGQQTRVIAHGSGGQPGPRLLAAST
jgi:hypothetical protein